MNTKKPNILFLMGDQHHAACLGTAGHDIVKTPNLDKLASEGTRLSSAYCQNPICTPSRMCFLTGQYAHNHGYYGLRGPLPHQLPNMFSELKKEGYHTGAIGKVHLPDDWIEGDTDFFAEHNAIEAVGLNYPDPLPMPPTWLTQGEGKLYPVRRLAEEHRKNPPCDFEPETFEAFMQRKLRGYYGNVTHTDWCMGEVIKMLEAQGLRDNTIIVYTSDHGDFACQYGLAEKAPGISSDAIGRIPFIISFPPSIPQNVVRDQLVESIDLWPTLSSFAGLEVKAMWDGKDVSDIIVNDGPGVRSAAYTENPFTRCMTTKDWRMTCQPDTLFPNDPVRGELYNRAEDPWEQNNLYHDPKYKDLICALKSEMLTWLTTTLRPVNAAGNVLAHPTLERAASEHVAGNAPFPEDGKTAISQFWKHVEVGNEVSYL